MTADAPVTISAIDSSGNPTAAEIVGAGSPSGTYGMGEDDELPSARTTSAD